ncbi:hypothetical protein EYM_00995 [Ignicoccus islandicus DSM 13165]|uniref:Uncharacterized protein n=1 Tax=Ignicoccus islandicus DSM 13165 TaxID=940295 RepID=A0A0U3F3P7_9CREN|nr:hypothetical protein EYM_00995 [Ignicoccus islandicus DSM 13165]
MFLGLGVALLIALLLYISLEIKLVKKIALMKSCNYFNFQSLESNGTCEIRIELCNPTNRTVYVDFESEVNRVEYLSMSSQSSIYLNPFERKEVDVLFKPLGNESYVGLSLSVMTNSGELVEVKSVIIDNKCKINENTQN